MLGHHYQRDEVIEFADVTGDSFKLAQAGRRPARRSSTSSSAACTSWPSRPTSSPPTTQTVDPCPTWPLAARWPTWPRLAQVEDCVGRTWSTSSVSGIVRRRATGDLHELGGRRSRRSPAGTAARSARRPTPSTALQVGVRPDRRGRRHGARCCSCPTSISAATPPSRELGGCHSNDCVVWDPHKPHGRRSPVDQLREGDG